MKQRVLVVDDDQLVADTLTLIFQTHGFDSRARYSAAEGLRCARSFTPELVLCDVTMPEGSGLDLAEQMNREQPHCKLLMFTAYTSNTAKVELESLRLQRPLKLLSKPCRPEDLLREVRALLTSSEGQPPLPR